MARRYRKGRPVRRKAQRKPAPRKKKRTAAERKKALAAKRKNAERKAYLKRARDFGFALSQLKKQYAEQLDFADIDAQEIKPVSVHDSIDEAKAALGEQQTRFQQRSAFTSGLTLGLSIVAVLGVGLVLVYVLFRKKDQDGAVGEATRPNLPPIIIQNVPSSVVEKPVRVALEDAEPSVGFEGWENPIIED